MPSRSIAGGTASGTRSRSIETLGGEILEQAADDLGLALLVALPGGSTTTGEGSAELRERLSTGAGDARIAPIGSHAARFDYRPSPDGPA